METLAVNSRIQIPHAEFDWTFVRSSGPGGQNVNKVNSKAVLRWGVGRSPSLPDDVRARFRARFAARITSAGELVVTSQRYRDQGRNVEDCLAKLREMLASVAARPKQRRPTKPKASDVRRRLEAKKLSGAKKKSRQRSDWD
ncbi:MAG: aminoacyl-tRNA hydrolase [Planctomycetaceae bacterium]|nr:aminoacyl-tRNA hydrolase [Planctomycetaceae bacterium]